MARAGKCVSVRHVAAFAMGLLFAGGAFPAAAGQVVPSKDVTGDGFHYPSTSAEQFLDLILTLEGGTRNAELGWYVEGSPGGMFAKMPTTPVSSLPACARRSAVRRRVWSRRTAAGNTSKATIAASMQTRSPARRITPRRGTCSGRKKADAMRWCSLSDGRASRKSSAPTGWFAPGESGSWMGYAAIPRCRSTCPERSRSAPMPVAARREKLRGGAEGLRSSARFWFSSPRRNRRWSGLRCR